MGETYPAEETLVIDWSSDESHLMLNPRMPAPERERLQRIVASAPPLPAHVWIATSGTTGSLKLTGLSKRALLASAAGVNQHLAATADDVWCCVLPTFHVGGLGIYARAELTGSRVVAFDWNPERFARTAFSLGSLVPAQLRDLVRAGLSPSRSVRGVVLGGGVVPDDLYDAAVRLGWPVFPSYGMTECSSQVATATVSSRDLRVLPHLSVRVQEDGRLAFFGASLLTGYATEEGFHDPKIDGWFVSDDIGDLHGGVVRVTGRSEDFVKIGGESVDLRRLDAILDALRGNIDAAVIAVDDERLGSVIHLACATDDPQALIAAFNARVLPFERIRGVVRVPAVPRSALGKLLRRQVVTGAR
jgi:O-succinylbenzoic acid--CoA ligase